jgi:hypothetical protein
MPHEPGTHNPRLFHSRVGQPVGQRILNPLMEVRILPREIVNSDTLDRGGALMGDLTPNDWEWWYGAWRGRVRCGSCGAIMELAKPCPVCGHDYRKVKPEPVEIDGETFLLGPVFQGPLDWSPHVMLKLLHQEWIRPAPANTTLSENCAPSSRAAVVVIAWTYFEAMMDFYFNANMENLHKPIAHYLLKQHNSIGRKLEQLHTMLFGRTFWVELSMDNNAHVAEHFQKVQKQRNDFIHGNPEAIDDSMVRRTVDVFPAMQLAWIAAFNRNRLRPFSDRSH